MRRKYKYYVDNNLCKAKFFWRYLRSYYVKPDYTIVGPDCTLVLNDKGYNMAVRAIKNGYIVVPENTLVVFRREEVYA